MEKLTLGQETHANWAEAKDLPAQENIFGLFYFRDGIGSQGAKYVLGTMAHQAWLGGDHTLHITATATGDPFRVLGFCSELVAIKPGTEFLFIRASDDSVSLGFCELAAGIIEDCSMVK